MIKLVKTERYVFDENKIKIGMLATATYSKSIQTSGIIHDVCEDTIIIKRQSAAFGEDLYRVKIDDVLSGVITLHVADNLCDDVTLVEVKPEEPTCLHDGYSMRMLKQTVINEYGTNVLYYAQCSRCKKITIGHKTKLNARLDYYKANFDENDYGPRIFVPVSIDEDGVG